MYKLKDIIKSGGANAKINRFINKYILSKDEKKDVIKEIKNSKGGSSDSLYFIVDTNTTQGTEEIGKAAEYFMVFASTMSYASIGTGGYAYVINMPIMSQAANIVPLPDRFMCYKIVLGHIEIYSGSNNKKPINADINNKEDLFNFLSSFSNIDANVFKDFLKTEITEEQFFDKQWLLNKADELS